MSINCQTEPLLNFYICNFQKIIFLKRQYTLKTQYLLNILLYFTSIYAFHSLLYLEGEILYDGVLVLLFPTPDLVTSCWQLEIGHGGNIYTMGISKCYTLELSSLPQSSLLNIHQYFTIYNPMLVSWGQSIKLDCIILFTFFFYKVFFFFPVTEFFSPVNKSHLL